MVIGWKPARAFILIPFALLLFTLCAAARPNAALAAQGNTNGAAGKMPAFFNGTQFTINIKEQPAGAETALLANNKNVNQIYAQADLDKMQPFPPVINAIQGNGFNPLWHQNLIVFKDPTKAHAFTSEAAVLAAAAPGGEITLITTGTEVYRCSVVGPGPK